MRLLHFGIALVALPAAIATNRDSTVVHSTTSTKVKCATLYSSKSHNGAVKTSTSTTTEHPSACRITTTTHHVSTFTPKPSTCTKTVKKSITVTTTYSGPPDKFTSTISSYTTKTFTSHTLTTDTVTADPTTVTTTDLTIIPTSDGFLPVESTTSSEYPDTEGKKRSMPRWVYRGPAKRSNTSPANFAPRNSKPKSYLASVSCKKEVIIQTTSTIIKTGVPYTTTKHAVTITSTKTSTVTKTSTKCGPKVTLTRYTTTTFTIPQTTTVTDKTISTTTPTVYEGVPATSYAACIPTPGPNYRGPNLPAGGITSFNEVETLFYIPDGPITAYDCCAECQREPYCVAGVTLSPANAAEIGYSCQLALFLDVNGFGPEIECAQQSYHSVSYNVDAAIPDGFFTVSNGPCGYAYENDIDSSPVP